MGRRLFNVAVIAAAIVIGGYSQAETSPPKLIPLTDMQVSSLKALAPGRIVDLKLGSQSVRLVASSIHRYATAMLAVYGKSTAGSPFYLVSVNGELSGSITAFGTRYNVQRTPKGSYVASIQAPRLRMVERLRTPRKNGHQARVSSISPLTTSIDEHPRIDILVLFTAKAQSDFKGEHDSDLQAAANLRAAVDRAIVITNNTFANSTLPESAHIAGVEKVGFVETDHSDADLDRLSGVDTNPHVEPYAELRAKYRADIVMLIRSGGDMDGISYELSSVDPDDVESNRNAGYGAIKDTCIAQGFYCFTHELGHTLGAGHNIEADQGHLYDDSRGWSFPDEDGNWYGTMMDYKHAENRIFYFSNPDVMYKAKSDSPGVRTGVADKANNARAIRSGGPYVSQYY